MILFKDLNIGDIPLTPVNLSTIPNTDEADETILFYAKRYGHPVGYLQEQNGKIVQNIFPIKKSAENQISSSSKAVLELHTEAAFHPHLPDYLLLLCLRGDENAGTTYALLSDVLKDIHIGIINILKKDLFETSVDESFRLNGEKNTLVRLPILTIDSNGQYKMKYDRTVMSGITTEAQMALNIFNKAIERNKQTIFLNTGDLIIIDNATTVHGRTSFNAKYDGSDRWLKRVVVRKEIDSINSTSFCPETGYIIINKYKDDDNDR
jgi:alpha-ketoglutarate-dependent taurine dioxygenase